MAKYGHSVGFYEKQLGFGPGTENKQSLVLRKPVFGVSDQVLHKPGCTATEDG